MTSRIAAAAALAAACAGCGADLPAGDGPSPPPRLELGAGLVEFVPLPPEGGAMEIVSGPQGGHHLELTARLYHLDPDGLALDYEVRDGETGAVLSLPATYALSAERVIDEGDHLLRVGDRTVLDVPSPGEVAGRQAEIRAAALREGEPVATVAIVAIDARRVTLVDEVDELE